VTNKLTDSPAHGVIYSLGWWENPVQKNKTTDELFADFRECDINAFHGKITSEKAFTIQGRLARDTVVFANDLVVLNRFIRVGPRIYSLWVLSPSRRPDIGNAGKFLNSFSLH
jgi:hypothetical protein